MALTAKKVYAILKRQISDMEAKLNSPVRYRGTVATADLLPLNPDIGDMYNIESKSVYGEAGMNVAWNGVVWDTMGAPTDMSLYIKSSELADWVKQQNKPTYTAEEVGALPADTKIPSKTSDLKNDSGFLTKVPDSYLNGTDTTLKESGKAADAKATGDKFTEMSADISKKLDKNQGSENSGKIAGINETGDIVPMFPMGVEYNSETNCLEFGSDQKMKLNQGIGLDSSLTKTGYAADAGVVGEVTNSLKEDISTKITKFYASNQGETHITDSDNGKIQDMMVYGKSSQDGTPTPDDPVEIKSVVNPTVKVVGKNIINGKRATHNAIIFEVDKVVIKGNTETYGEVFAEHTLKKGTYTISCECNYINRIEITIDGITKPAVNKTRNNYTFTIDKDSSATFTVVVYGNVADGVDYIQLEKGSVATLYEPYHEQTVTLPYTLNAIPVSSGGNVTINGQQYIADYVDVERGRVVRNIENLTFNGAENENWELWNTDKEKMWSFMFKNSVKTFVNESASKCNRFEFEANESIDRTFWLCNPNGMPSLQIKNRIIGKDITAFKSWLSNNPIDVIYPLRIPIEEELTAEHAQALKELATYYPVTNISIGSEQLDGYTVFNYPISMKNGWNYVKQQLNDNRDYIYDMDIQAAEAYVNSEYAVALTELEV